MPDPLEGSPKTNPPVREIPTLREALEEINAGSNSTQESNRLVPGNLSPNERRLEDLRQEMRIIEQRLPEIELTLQRLSQERSDVNRRLIECMMRLLREPSQYHSIRREMAELETRRGVLQQIYIQLNEEQAAMIERRYRIQLEAITIESAISSEETIQDMQEINAEQEDIALAMTTDRLVIRRQACGCSAANIPQPSSRGISTLIPPGIVTFFR